MTIDAFRCPMLAIALCALAGLIACSNMLDEAARKELPLFSSCGLSRGGCAPPARGINPYIEWEWTGSTSVPLSMQVMSAPAVANLNDDNGDGVVDDNDIPDIIFLTFTNNLYTNNGLLRATSGDGSGDLFTVTGYNISPGTNMAVGDIDGDSLPEIVVREGNAGGTDGVIRLLAFNHDGTYLWRSTSIEMINTIGISLADIDHNGSPEIITDSTVVHNDGTLLWTGHTTGRHNSCAVNLDMTGDLEVVMGNTAYRSNGTVYWQNASLAQGSTAAGNFDEDISPEIILVATGTDCPQVYCLEHDGTIKWGPVDLPRGPEYTQPVYHPYGSIPVITDADGDGQPEIGVSSPGGVFLLETDGAIKWRSVGRDYSSGMIGCSAFDLDEDGSAEILQNDEYNFRIFRGIDGFILYEVNVGSATLYEMPVVADIDHDNQAEIVVASNNYAFNLGHAGLVIFGDIDTTWPNTRKIWNQGDYHVANIGETGLVPIDEGSYWLTGNHFRQAVITEPVADSDLSISDISVDVSAYPLAVDFTVTVRNGGPRRLLETALVSFYDGDPLSGGSLLGTASLNPTLTPCAAREVCFTWDSPTSGLRDIYIVADDDGHGRSRICEPDRENNTGNIMLQLP